MKKAEPVRLSLRVSLTHDRAESFMRAKHEGRWSTNTQFFRIIVEDWLKAYLTGEEVRPSRTPWQEREERRRAKV